SYLRVKIWRRLQRLGAVAIKNSVYALPRSDGALEDLQWIRREIVAGGGDGSICEARFVDGLDRAEVIAMLDAARDQDYPAPPAGAHAPSAPPRPPPRARSWRASRSGWPRSRRSTSSAPRDAPPPRPCSPRCTRARPRRPRPRPPPRCAAARG